MSFRTLTIGKKITIGFVSLFALLSLVAVIAFTALGGAGRRLTLFAESAQETFVAVSLESSMQAVKLHVNDFLASGSAERRKLTAPQRQCPVLSVMCFLYVESILHYSRQVSHASGHLIHD